MAPLILLMPFSFRESIEELESFYRQKEDRLRTAHGDHVEELELRISDLTDRCRGLVETHREELEGEKEKRKKDLSTMAEEHKEAIQVLLNDTSVAYQLRRGNFFNASNSLSEKYSLIWLPFHSDRTFTSAVMLTVTLTSFKLWKCQEFGGFWPCMIP